MYFGSYTKELMDMEDHDFYENQSVCNNSYKQSWVILDFKQMLHVVKYSLTYFHIFVHSKKSLEIKFMILLNSNCTLNGKSCQDHSM